MAKKPICCIYKIVNIVNKKYYIGSTVDFKSRVSSHKSSLKLNNHKNMKLQNAYNKYGEDKFIFKIVKVCNLSNVKKIEQKILDKLDYKKVYNISSSASGGDLISNHPNREAIVKKSIEILARVRNAPGYIEFRRQITKGENNPNYNNRWNKAQKKRMSKRMKAKFKNMSLEEKERLREIHKKNQREFWDSEEGLKKREILAKKMKGKGNPFYGKKHPKKIMDKIIAANKGRTNEKEWKPVTIEGIEYKSLGEASKILKVPLSTVCYRLNSTNPDFKNWNYKGQSKEVIPIKTGHSLKFRYKDQIFESIIKACKFLNISRSQAEIRAKSNDPKWADYEILEPTKHKTKKPKKNPTKPQR